MPNIRTLTIPLFLLLGIASYAAPSPRLPMPTAPAKTQASKDYLQKQYRIHTIIDITLATIAICTGLIAFLVYKYSHDANKQTSRFSAFYKYGGWAALLFFIISCIVRHIMLAVKTSQPTTEKYRIQAQKIAWIADGSYLLIRVLLATIIIERIDRDHDILPMAYYIGAGGLGGFLFLANAILRLLFYIETFPTLARPQKSHTHTKTKKQTWLLKSTGVATILLFVLLPLGMQEVSYKWPFMEQKKQKQEEEKKKEKSKIMPLKGAKK